MRIHNIVLLAALLLAPAGARATDQPPVAIDFSREILPILSDKCFVCHGPDTDEGSTVRLDSYEAATSDLGGYRAIDPQDLESSELLLRITSADDPMPPEDAEKQLTDQEKQLLAQWVAQGGTYSQHWAFVPPKKRVPTRPADRDANPHVNLIDSFVAAKQSQRSIRFAPQAERETLARRASLVLCGLPPEPDELGAFLHDQRPDAYERYVDRLLNKPDYGEHQARHWLDAVRYGDTHGLHLDNRRGVFPYRDWVVSALNANLPLDDFITWQLAGDLLPDPGIEQLVATGYVRMNPTSGEGGAIEAEYQAKNNFDRTENLGAVFLGMTLTCARCHTHKYDPVPQTEYYRLMAFFNSTSEPALDRNKYDYGPTTKAPRDPGQWARWKQLEAARDKLFATAMDQMAGVELDAKGWAEATDQEKLDSLADPDGGFATLPVHPQARSLRADIEALSQSFTTTLVAKDLPTPRPTRVLNRGEYNLPIGDPLEPGVLSVMGDFPEDAPRNRLGLARWLTSPNHPTVARVLINRLWQQTFGQGLVRTPEDFGVQGAYPTHPDLLDWLAVELQDSGWDLKHMLRLMVTSRTFRQSSAWRDDVDDPENRYWSRGPSYRLDAEVIRDIGLWAGQLLDPEMGGEGVKPYQPAGMWSALAHPASNTKLYERDNGRRLYRRSLYVYWKRTSPHPMMTLFDAPDRETSCVRRSRTSTALQSLALLNETQRIEMARMLAQRLLLESSDTASRLDLLFRLIASRGPSPTEADAINQLLDQMRARYREHQDDARALLATGEAESNQSLDPALHAAWTQVALTLLASDLAIILY
ncbi:PSD1 and planctomycete cytochrome C domain-containing protein [Stieleria mannarensis]|uniref:PSD1 and planctomycete cytochrome C domain-containing protein n=1 Tax=Stieleria mannarensis TaxID=2755585 RepID=UPI001C727F63|nr:PSD1 and planctomycete cytochrome C domain-containing protein [Rhodopirellula sp. JC639]